MSLAAYKKASAEKLDKALAAVQGKFKKDPRYWEVTKDKAGNGFAIIRFLDRPIVDGEEATAFIQYYTHQFQGPGGWYIENSLTTIDQQDPVGEYNAKLWNTGLEENQKIAKAQKRKLTYVSNILVVKDPAKPENDGNVFLYKYGKKIFDKIMAKKNPRDGELDPNTGEPLQPVNIFDLWEGANFSLKVKLQGEFPNYDDSFFAPVVSPIAKTDEAIEAIINKAYSLKAELKFKSYDELKKRLDRVLAFNADGSQQTPSADKAKVNSPVPEAVKQALGEAKKLENVAATGNPSGDVSSEEDDMSFFKDMASDD